MALANGNLKINIGVNNNPLKSGLADATRLIKKFAGAGIGGFAFLEIAEAINDISILGKRVDNVTRSFQRFENSTKFLTDLRKSSGGAVSDLKLMEESLKAINLGVDRDVLPTFFEFASIRAAETGEKVDYLISSIVTGLGRGSPRILDNLGIGMERLGKGFENAADKTGILADIINTEMRKAVISIGDAIPIQIRLNALWDNFRQQLGRVVLVIQTFIGRFIDANGGIESLQARIDNLFPAFIKLANAIITARNELAPFRAALSIFWEAIITPFRILYNIFTGIGEAAKGLAQVMVNIATGEWRKVGEAWDSTVQGMRDSTFAVFDAIVESYGNIKKAFEDTEPIELITEEEINSIKNFGKEAKSSLSAVRVEVERLGITADVLDKIGDALTYWDRIIRKVRVEFESSREYFSEFFFQMFTMVEENGKMIKKFFGDLKMDVTETMQALTFTLVTGLAEGLGNLLSGDDFFQPFLQRLGNFLKQFGEAAVFAGTLQLKFLNALKNPSFGNAFALIGLGAAAVAIGSALSNASRSFNSSGGASSGSSFAVAASQGDVGGYGRIAEQPDINIFLNGYELTKGLRRQNFYNDRTGG